MAGKLSERTRDYKIGDKINSNTVKMCSTKSILCYQNGSESSALNRACASTEPDELMDESQKSPICDGQNMKDECLDVVRKKLITDLSLNVFCADLENKLIKMEPKAISKERLTIIQKLLVQISQLSDAEKLLLYLKLPSSTSSLSDPLRQPLNPLGNRQEIQQTIVWIKTHLEEDREISIPKQDVYDQYLKYCENVSMKPLSTADFGKVMKQVYPGVRPRRLGTRGNSRYCYSGMRNTCKLPTPVLPQLVQRSKLSNGNVRKGSHAGSNETEKSKKSEKTKRKWKTSCRSNKIFPAQRSAKSNGKDGLLKNPKRTKIEDLSSVKENELIGSDVKQDILNMQHLEKSENWKVERDKCQVSPNSNSFNSGSRQLENDLGIYFDNVDKVNAKTTISASSEYEAKANLSDLQSSESGAQLTAAKNLDDGKLALKSEQKEKSLSPIQRLESDKIMFDKLMITNNDGGVASSGSVSDLEHLNVVPGPIDSRSRKLKSRRSNSFSKNQRNFTKSYVPIQPKPVGNAKLKVHFELSERRPADRGQHCDTGFCEESDSQEPEEEIVRYFQHLEENQFFGCGIVQKAVKDMKNGSVQIKGSIHNTVKSNSDLVDEAAFQSRSQSCFEGKYRVSKPAENSDKYNIRSQSSVEFSAEDRRKPVSVHGDFKPSCDKVSHLRLLLERSVVDETQGNRSLSRSACLPKEEKFTPGTCFSSQLQSDFNGCIAGSSNSILTHKFPKLEDEKGFNVTAGPMPPSPNTRSKYFNFTPISPRPQSPLKTPTTPSASPFVSPRSTPNPRQRQIPLPSDHFVHPMKSVDRAEKNLKDEKNFSYAKSGSHKSEGNFQKTSDGPLSRCERSLLCGRPRSNSSTNFYRAKAKRNLSKVLSCDLASFRDLDTDCNGVDNFIIGATTSLQTCIQTVGAGESLSSEIRQLLENNSKIPDIQSASSRSQSVPLNRMVSEGSWFSDQTPIYDQYMNSTNDQTLGSRSQLSTADFNGFVSNSDPGTKNLEPFISNDQMSVIDQMNQGMFARDVQLNDQLFADNFESNNGDDYNQSASFVQETVFSNGMDLNANPSFEGSFADESDSVISDSMKPFLSKLGESIPSNKSTIGHDGKPFGEGLYSGSVGDAKDPVITSFKPAFIGEFSSCPTSPILGFFGTKGSEDSQLIEFLGLDG